MTHTAADAVTCSAPSRLQFSLLCLLICAEMFELKLGLGEKSGAAQMHLTFKDHALIHRLYAAATPPIY